MASRSASTQIVRLLGVDRIVTLILFYPLASMPASTRADILSPLFLPLKSVESSLENHQENLKRDKSTSLILPQHGPMGIDGIDVHVYGV